MFDGVLNTPLQSITENVSRKITVFWYLIVSDFHETNKISWASCLCRLKWIQVVSSTPYGNRSLKVCFSNLEVFIFQNLFTGPKEKTKTFYVCWLECMLSRCSTILMLSIHLTFFHEAQIKAFYYTPLHFFKKGTLAKFTLEVFTN